MTEGQPLMEVFEIEEISKQNFEMLERLQGLPLPVSIATVMLQAQIDALAQFLAPVPALRAQLNLATERLINSTLAALLEEVETQEDEEENGH